MGAGSRVAVWKSLTRWESKRCGPSLHKKELRWYLFEETGNFNAGCCQRDGVSIGPAKEAHLAVRECSSCKFGLLT